MKGKVGLYMAPALGVSANFLFPPVLRILGLDPSYALNYELQFFLHVLNYGPVI